MLRALCFAIAPVPVGLIVPSALVKQTPAVAEFQNFPTLSPAGSLLHFLDFELILTVLKLKVLRVPFDHLD